MSTQPAADAASDESAAPRRQRPVVLVTGVPGVTGSSLCAVLSNRYEVHAVSRRRAPANIAASITWHQIDLTQTDFTRQLPDRVDAVVHLAQSRRFREFPAGIHDVFGVNVAAVVRLLDWARGAGARHVTIASSGSVYPPSRGVLRETDALAPRAIGFYAATKVAAELLASAYVGEFIVTVLRPFFIYGPGQDEAMLVPRLIRSVRNGEPVRLSGSDGFRFTPTHVSDVVRAVAASLDAQDSHIINIGGPQVLTLRDACDVIGNAMSIEPVFERAEGEPDSDFVPDLARMHSLLSAPTVRFEEGLATLIANGRVAGGR